MSIWTDFLNKQKYRVIEQNELIIQSKEGNLFLLLNILQSWTAKSSNVCFKGVFWFFTHCQIFCCAKGKTIILLFDSKFNL